jgi:predicted nucleotidyltransferase
MKKLSNKNHKKSVEDLIKSTAKELSRIKQVKAVYLFGSQATGKARPYSDIDICVFTEWPLDKKSKLDILGSSSKKISVHLFHELPNRIQFRVFRDGVALYTNDEKYLHNCRIITVQRYLDFKPTLERHHEIILKGI